jgi:hypothetical protein
VLRESATLSDGGLVEISSGAYVNEIGRSVSERSGKDCVDSRPEARRMTRGTPDPTAPYFGGRRKKRNGHNNSN